MTDRARELLDHLRLYIAGRFSDGRAWLPTAEDGRALLEAIGRLPEDEHAWFVQSVLAD